MNCAAIPEELIESELFGHRKGSFTGAQRGQDRQVPEGRRRHAVSRRGRRHEPEDAGQGAARAGRAALRAGGRAESIQVDVRVVAATNKNLEEEIERGNFREDLFYRLNVIPFHVPPLRDRMRRRAAAGRSFPARVHDRLRPQAQGTDAGGVSRVLQEYHWPGNVRELRNLMERIVIMNPQVRIDARHIPLHPARRQVFDRPVDRFGSLQEVREAAEREYILKKLEETKAT